MKTASHDFGYRSLGPGFLARLYTGNWGVSFVDTKGGDIISYARRPRHKLDTLPSKELVRAIFMDSLVIIEYALKDLSTTGHLRKATYSGSIRYNKNQLEAELSWIFDRDDEGEQDRYTFEYCCEVLNLSPKVIRGWLLKRILQARKIAKEIQEGKREAKPQNNTSRQAGLSAEDPDKDSFKLFFRDLETL